MWLLDKLGKEGEGSKFTSKIEYQWQNLIIVCWQIVTDTVAYSWTAVCLYGDAIEENPYENWLVLPKCVANTTL